MWEQMKENLLMVAIIPGIIVVAILLLLLCVALVYLWKKVSRYCRLLSRPVTTKIQQRFPKTLERIQRFWRSVQPDIKKVIKYVALALGIFIGWMVVFWLSGKESLDFVSYAIAAILIGTPITIIWSYLFRSEETRFSLKEFGQALAVGILGVSLILAIFPVLLFF